MLIQADVDVNAQTNKTPQRGEYLSQCQRVDGPVTPRDSNLTLCDISRHFATLCDTFVTLSRHLATTSRHFRDILRHSATFCDFFATLLRHRATFPRHFATVPRHLDIDPPAMWWPDTIELSDTVGHCRTLSDYCQTTVRLLSDPCRSLCQPPPSQPSWISSHSLIASWSSRVTAVTGVLFVENVGECGCTLGLQNLAHAIQSMCSVQNEG